MSKKKMNVFCEKPGDPTFIRLMKEKIGYKEGPTIDAKKEQLPATSRDDEDDNEEEQPTIVVLTSGDLNQDEVNEIKEKALLKPGKIVFKAPNKSSEGIKNPLIVSTSKRAAEDVDTKTKTKVPKSDTVVKSNLLSFGDDDEEEES